MKILENKKNKIGRILNMLIAKYSYGGIKPSLYHHQFNRLTKIQDLIYSKEVTK